LDAGRAVAIAEVLADRFNAAGPHSDDPGGPRAARLAGLVAGPETLGAFRTPTLRNLALTAPYLHDGRYETLAEVVRYKTTLPDTPAVGALDPALRPYPATAAEIDDLVAFLNALTAPPLDASLTTAPP
jgi:cytochrome c peroxidase